MPDDAVQRLDRIIDGLYALAQRAGDDDVIPLTAEDAAFVRETTDELMRLYRQRHGPTDRLS